MKLNKYKKTVTIIYQHSEFLEFIESFLTDLSISKQKITNGKVFLSPSTKLIILESPEGIDTATIKEQIEPLGYMEIRTVDKVPISFRVSHFFNDDADIIIKQTINALLQNNNDLSIFDLPDLLQMISAERKKMALKIIGAHKLGIIVFKEGKIIYSRVDELSGAYFGEEALYLILSWENPVVWVFSYPENITPNIETDLSFLLMDAMRYIDEMKASGKTSDHISLNIKEYLYLHNVKNVKFIAVMRNEEILDSWFDKTVFKEEQIETINKNLIKYFVSGRKLALTFFQKPESYYIASKNFYVFINRGKEYNTFIILKNTDSVNVFLIRMMLTKMVREFEL